MPCVGRLKFGGAILTRRARAAAATDAASRQLLPIVEEGYFKDVLIFAAAHNDHPLTRSYPAAFAPSLLSVDKRLFDDPLSFAYELHEPIEFLAHGRGYLGPFAHEPATSWAAPHLAGIAARLLSLRPELKPFEVKTLLYWMFQARKKATNECDGCPHGVLTQARPNPCCGRPRFRHSPLISLLQEVEGRRPS